MLADLADLYECNGTALLTISINAAQIRSSVLLKQERGHSGLLRDTKSFLT
jgi:hypothetical protein